MAILNFTLCFRATNCNEVKVANNCISVSHSTNCLLWDVKAKLESLDHCWAYLDFKFLRKPTNHSFIYLFIFNGSMVTAWVWFIFTEYIHGCVLQACLRLHIAVITVMIP